MGNRYTNEGRDPRDLYDDSSRHGDNLGGRDTGRGRRFNDTANRRYPAFRDRSPGGENYFGSGRQGYGDGIEDAEPNHSFGSSWRDSTGYSNYETPERRYDSTRRRAGFGRDAFGLGYGGDWEPESNRRRYENRNYDRNRYEESYASQRDNNQDYPSSESGFYGNRSERDRNDRSWWDRASDEVSSWFGGDERDRGYRDDRSRGHRGRGPKNYTRSDERIRDDINDRLTDFDYLDASDIDVSVENGEVILTGNVNSRYEKRTAEDIVEDVSGVKNVENRLRINQNQNQPTGSNFGYDQVTGHGELNRQEVNATQGDTPNATTTDQSRSASGNR
jgi:osmotically-inducible protein OsmY